MALASHIRPRRPAALWLTGLSGAGKTTIAKLVEAKLASRGSASFLLDGDEARQGLGSDLGFSAQDRAENVRRAAEMAKMVAKSGSVVIAAFISPLRSDRALARAILRDCEFMEIHVDAPLALAEQRDPKGLYKKARSGEISNFTGIDSPYEAPESPELAIDTQAMDAEAAAELIVATMEAKGLIEHSAAPRARRSQAKPPFFCKAGDHAFPVDEIASLDFSRIEQLRLGVVLKSGLALEAFDIEALELAMQTKPSALEGRLLRHAKRAWWFHNLVGHPLMQLLAALGSKRLAFVVHDRTVPMPLGAKASRAGATQAPKA